MDFPFVLKFSHCILKESFAFENVFSGRFSLKSFALWDFPEEIKSTSELQNFHFLIGSWCLQGCEAGTYTMLKLSCVQIKFVFFSWTYLTKRFTLLFSWKSPCLLKESFEGKNFRHSAPPCALEIAAIPRISYILVADLKESTSSLRLEASSLKFAASLIRLTRICINFRVCTLVTVIFIKILKSRTQLITLLDLKFYNFQAWRIFSIIYTQPAPALLGI